MFSSQGEAKRFFVEKILAQAAAEGTSLSDAERRMLSFSESDPDFVVDSALVEQLSGEISDEDYEARIAGLLERSFKRALDPQARDQYREAYSVLGRGDHYLLVMIERALGRKLRPWWVFWR